MPWSFSSSGNPGGFNMQSSGNPGGLFGFAIVINGLVLQLDAGNPVSYPGTGTTWTNLRGASTATLTNSPTFNSANGGSISFTGTAFAPVTPFAANFPVGSAVRTMSAWFNATTFSGGREIFGIGANSGNGSRVGLWLDSAGTLGYEVQGAGLVTSDWPGLNNWVNLTVVTGATAHAGLIYVNGTRRTNTTTLGSNVAINTATSATGQCVIATVPNANTVHLFQGRIATVFMYNRGLTADEVSQNFNATRGRFGV